MRILLTGWFSFEQMGATAGDLLCRDLLAEWMREAALPFDVAVATPFSGGVDWREIEPTRYTDVVFVCGPFGNGPPLTDFLKRFDHARFVGINLSMLQRLEEWNPFQLLLERDSSRTCRPDLSLLSDVGKVPVVGLILAHLQSEYGDRARHAEVDAKIHDFLERQNFAVVPIDTRLDENSGKLRNASQVESLIAKMDTVITTRLHGTVLAIKQGVPPVCIDAIAGGEKVYKQATSLGWPVVAMTNQLTDQWLEEAFAYCLSPQARRLAAERRDVARAQLANVRDEMVRFLSSLQTVER